MKGRVKWFNSAKGYGFLTPESGEDVFIHHSAVTREQKELLVEQAALEFDVVAGPKGPSAKNVKFIAGQ